MWNISGCPCLHSWLNFDPWRNYAAYFTVATSRYSDLWPLSVAERRRIQNQIRSKLSNTHSRWGMLVVDVWSKMALVRGPGRLQELIRLDCGVIGDSLPRNEEHTPTLSSTNITDITATIHSPHHTTQHVASTVILLGKWILELEINQYSVGLF